MSSNKQIEHKGVRFNPSWTPDNNDKSVVVLRNEGAEANYAVRIGENEKGNTLELLTKQVNEKNKLEWKPAKTPSFGDPEKVIREAEYREARIGKSWKLDTDKGVIVHKGGIFAARSVSDENGKNTGKVELLTKQGPKDKKEWMPAKNPCVGTPEQVFQTATYRQWNMDEINAFRKKPVEYVKGYIKGKDGKDEMIFKHPGNRHAVRIHSISEDGKTAKLEVLTTQYNAEKKSFEWKPSKKPFIGTPSEAYSEIGNREYGIAQGKIEEARRIEEATKRDKELAGNNKPAKAQDGSKKIISQTPAKVKIAESKKNAPAKKTPAPAKIPKKGRSM